MHLLRQMLEAVNKITRERLDRSGRHNIVVVWVLKIHFILQIDAIMWAIWHKCLSLLASHLLCKTAELCSHCLRHIVEVNQRNLEMTLKRPRETAIRMNETRCEHSRNIILHLCSAWYNMQTNKPGKAAWCCLDECTQQCLLRRNKSRHCSAPALRS